MIMDLDDDEEEEDPDRIVVSTVEFQGRSEDKWYKIFLALGVFPTFCTTIALMSECGVVDQDQQTKESWGDYR